MRVLIVSSTSWDNFNSFGNTFSNLFENMEDVEIYNICCQSGSLNNKVVKKAIQFSDKTVFKNIFTGKDPAHTMSMCGEIVKKEDLHSFAKKKFQKIKHFLFTMRDAVWKVGAWKRSKTLKQFLQEVQPDVVYLPIYASTYMCYVQRYIIDQLGVPVVGHISDDVYGYTPKSSIFARSYTSRLRRQLRKLIDKCEYLEVFAENMKEEYSRIFKKDCYVIGKGIAIQDSLKIEYVYSNQEEWKFVYTGNIGSERYKILSAIGQAFDAISSKRKLTLDIYSATPLTEEIEKAFAPYQSIRFKGAISKDEVERVQREADFLVHVESFSKQAIFSAKMSFSTKIIDYMAVGKPIFAVGPTEVNSIKVLQTKNLAVIAKSFAEIEEKTKALCSEDVDLSNIATCVERYLKEERDIRKIQKGIKQRLDKVVEQK